MELRKIYISDIGKIITGKTPRTSIADNYGGNIPFLTPSDDLTRKHVVKTSKTLSAKGLNEVKNCLIPEKSICVSCIGSDLGKVVMTSAPTVTNQQINSIVVKDEFDPDFIYYLMKIVGRELNFISKTSTAVPIINKSTFSNTEIFVPSLENQIRIGRILSSLDEKIENNRRINDNLELQAQALYKSWFVDFEPFKGQEFVESEFGLIPEGWHRTTISELLSIKYGKDHKKLAEGIVPVYGSGGLMRYVDTKLHEGEAVLIPRKGSLNNVMYVNEAFWTVDTMFYSIPKQEYSCIYAYLFLANKDLASMNAGSAVPSMTTDILNNMHIIAPPAEVLKRFNNICNVYFSRINQNNIENANLSKQRDTLLPKLMSGELKINEIDC